MWIFLDVSILSFLGVFLPTIVDADMNLLMVGNGYTEANNFEETVKAFLQEDAYANVSGKEMVYAMEFEKGSAKLEYFASPDILESFKSVMGERRWNWVVLQEQSETPGLWDTNSKKQFEASKNAVIELDKVISENGADTVLLLTWGREEQDQHFPALYPNFDTMLSRIQTGYTKYQEAISTPQRPVKIAPAGLAFKEIHDSLVDQGLDPTAKGSDFAKLYKDDDWQAHPSPLGTFLTACVVYSTLTGNDARKLKYAPFGIDEETQARLKEVSATTVSKYFDEYEKTNGIHFSNTQSSKEKEYISKDSPLTSSSRLSLSSLFSFAVFICVPLAILVGIRRYQKSAQTKNSSSTDVELTTFTESDSSLNHSII